MAGFVYFGIKWALIKHDDVLKISGGLEGVHHPALLESAIAFIKHEDYYPTFSDKLTHLIYSVAKNHIFADGNKRTAIALGGYFLTINGYEDLVPRYFIEMENIILWVAVDSLSKDNLCVILCDLVEYGEFGESSQLILFEASEKYNFYLETIEAEHGADINFIKDK